MAWSYPTNFSNGTAVDSLGTFVEYANYATNGWLVYGFLLIIFIMTFVIAGFADSKKALLSSSFVTFVFSIYFLRIVELNIFVVFVLIVGIIVGALGAKESGGSF